METQFFHVTVQWNEDRKGIMCSPELKEGRALNGCIEVATPPPFPKGISGIWSPEHLFTAAVCSCFMTTFLAIAENSKLNFTSFICRATGKLDQIEGKHLMTAVDIEPEVTITDQQDQDRALKVMYKTEKACLITNSIKAAVNMNPRILVGTEILDTQ